MKGKMSFRYLYILVYALPFLMLLIACKDVNQSSPEKGSGKMDSNEYKRIIVPDTMEVYAPFSKYVLDSIQLSTHHSLRIYTYVNVSCPSCIAGIEEWQKLVSTFMRFKVPVILICYSKDNFEYFKYLCEQGQVKAFSFPFYLDIKSTFSKLNPFFKEYVQDQTVLTDDNNRILFSGNPIHSDDILKSYLEGIKKKPVTQ